MKLLIVDRWLLLMVNLLLCLIQAIGCVQLDEIQWKCVQQCGQHLLTQADEIFDVHCNDTCRVQQCGLGCEQWREAIDKDNCRNICSKQNDSKVIPIQNVSCVIGCRWASGLYVQTVKEEVGVALAPVLVADSQSHVSLRIRWDPAPASVIPLPVSYYVQWKYDTLSGGWEYYQRSVGPTNGTSLLVDGLKPYTRYKFRVAWLILPQHEPLFSNQSLTMTTLPYGVPSSAPEVTSVVYLDATRLSVSWEAPPFPNGPIASYVLYLTLLSNGYTIIKDIKERSDNSFMFTNLRSNCNYTLSVTCRNGVGEGPKRVINITTPTLLLNANDRTEPYLILGAKQKVLQQTLDLSKEPKVIYKPDNESVSVQGVAIHVAKKLIYVSDSTGRLLRVTTGVSSSVDDVTPKGMSQRPSCLSVDWLNEQLYIVEGTSIGRMDLDGRHHQLIVTGLSAPPTDMKVDPYNGYLYWVVQGSSKGGLYQVDLGTIVKGQPLNPRNANLIVEDHRLATFAIDYRHFRLYFPNELNNTMCSATLNGGEVSDIRNNTQQPKFKGMTSLTYHKDVFYWTNGEDVLAEEYLSIKNRYYHTSFADPTAEKPFVGLNLLHPDAQDVPVPVNPVRNLQAVFLDSMARLSWQPPKPLAGLGSGAWQSWNYEIQLQRSDDGKVSSRLIRPTSGVMEHSVAYLSPSTNYSVQVRATSAGGEGPWSNAFHGTTLHSSSAYVLWSTSLGLLRSDLIGDNVEVVIDRSVLSERQMTIVDMSWYEDLVFVNTNTSEIYSLNVSRGHDTLKRLKDVTSAHSLAVDWLGRKLYWSCPKQQTISRCNLDGGQIEPLLIMTIAKELNIDSVNGFIYWTTSHTVECARLNGADRKQYFQTGFFSGKNVMGLALDVAGARIYWIVWGFDGASLYQAPTASFWTFSAVPGTSLNLPDEFGPLREENMQGPLRYFSHRLFWLHNDTVALVGNTDGNNVAQLQMSSPASMAMRLLTMAVVDPSLQPAPSNVNVIPEPVDWSSIKILGQWNNFNVSWLPISNVNYGRVFYEVGLDDQNITNGMVKHTGALEITEYPHYVAPSMTTIPPYTEVTVAVRAFTYWATSKRVIKSMRTPMSVPSEPVNPRAFVNSIQPSVTVEFRWEKPLKANGEILGYRVSIWNTDSQRPYIADRLVEQPSLTLHNFLANQTCYFEVRAYSEVGEGPSSPAVQVSTSNLSVVPKLLIVKTDSIYMLDFDNASDTLLARDITKPIDVTFHWSTGSLYWLDHSGSLMTSQLDGSNESELYDSDSSISGSPCVRMDWLAHRLYWSSSRRIYRMDLIAGRGKADVVVSSEKPIGCVALDPLTSSLVWTEMEWDRRGRIMISHINGSDVRQLFRRRPTNLRGNDVNMRTKRSNCNCSTGFRVSNALSFSSEELFFIDMEHNTVWASDLDGCSCRPVFNTSAIHLDDIPSTTMTSDLQRVYLSNSLTGVIYSVPRWSTEWSSPRALPYKVTGGITAYGHHLQPLPSLNCLQPKLMDGHKQLQLLEATSTTLSIDLSQLRPVDWCESDVRASKPTTKYIVRYVAEGGEDVTVGAEDGSGSADNELGSQQITTFNTSLLLTHLKAYTTYRVSVDVTNIYMDGALHGAEATFQTLEGAPWKPVSVGVVVLSPERAVVSWERPLVIRGPDVRYVIHTRKSQAYAFAFNSVDNSLAVTQPHAPHHYVITGLEPSRNYSVTVEACGVTSNVSNTSDVVNIRTFALPANLSLSNSTSTYLLLTWTSPTTDGLVKRHSIAYKEEVGTAQSTHLPWQTTVVGHRYDFNVTQLLPNTRYVFHMWLQYETDELNETYVFPKDNRFLFATKGDRPGRPGQPEARVVSRGQYVLSWRPSTANGGRELVYFVEAKLSEGNDSRWNHVYNDTGESWSADTLDPQLAYYLRVRARNEFGWSDYGDESRIVQLDQLTGFDEGFNVNLFLATIFPITAAIVLCFVFFFYRACRKAEKGSKKLLGGGPDFELATLSDMPLQRQNFIHRNNALYAFSDAVGEAELSGVPRIARDQIDLIKLLGSGAFGEVFKGLAKNLVEHQVIPVAIKTLKKGATDQEKSEFLKEAQLMSNFKHDHILRLLGVCLDNDPNFLILELMEGGDLLSYLRSKRATTFMPSLLSIQDLISICVDVAKGCCYLEELHFVHRDLAARNCLVSSSDPVERVVKIGDFGLARDVYKNDYYRKEGEGLLPVRWMSPESLVDGVFTSHSDVWAFGVLLWEVMTLGQQPYPARTNVEVLHFVRGGGRLDKPDNCPDDLHQLMIQCWSYDKSNRPSFKFCLEQLQELKRKSADLPLPICAVHNQAYLESRGSGTAAAANRIGVDNPAYSGDDGHSHTQGLNEMNGGSTNLAFSGSVALPDDVTISSNDEHRRMRMCRDDEGSDDDDEDDENDEEDDGKDKHHTNNNPDHCDVVSLIDGGVGESGGGFEPSHKYLELLYYSDHVCEPNYEVPLTKERSASTRGYSHLVDSWSVLTPPPNLALDTDDMKRYVGVSQPLLWPPTGLGQRRRRRRSYDTVGQPQLGAKDDEQEVKRRSLESEEATSGCSSGCSSAPTTPTRVSDISTSSTSGIDVESVVKVDESWS